MDPTVELLETELRWMEDNLYQMDEQLDRCCERLQSAHKNNQVLRQELASARAVSPQSAAVRPPGSPTLADSKTSNHSDDSEDFDEESDEELYDMSGVDIQLGDPDKEGSSSGERDDQDGDDGNSIEPEPLPSNGIQIEEFPERAAPRPRTSNDDADPFGDDNEADDQGQVQSIRLNPRLTGGYNFDGEPGHDGVMVVIEPLSADGEFTPAVGDLTIHLQDPAKPGLRGRIGKWKYSAVEATAFLKESLLGKGLHVMLPWPSQPPDAERLHLTVQYKSADGRKLQSKKDLLIIPPADSIARPSRPKQPDWSPDRPAPKLADQPTLDWAPIR